MKTSATNRKIRVLLHAIDSGTLIPRPDFQRRLVWTNKHKNAFIKTVLEGLPFPEIYVAAGDVDEETAEGIELLVDGQQRITTLQQYFKGSDELVLEKGIPAYKDLSKEDKLKFLEYEVVVRDLGAISIDKIKEVFQRINSTSYSLNAMEINNARYDGELKQISLTLSEKNFFEKYNVFSANDIRRMNDIKFCLTIFITILSTYFNRDNLFEEFLEKYNDVFPEKEIVFNQIVEVLDFIELLEFDKNSRVFKKSDLFTLIVEIHRILFKDKKQLSVKKTREVLDDFYTSIDKLKDSADPNTDFYKYYNATLQGTNNRSSRILRGSIIRKYLMQCIE
ncbi:DUF262 domain-containing protein [Aeribacillus pallidus]|uniref:DUF262 domain-containing protein n=1 Tax=Aeribacillus pallidus TaxID=33936 RepID=UPI003D23FD92